MDEHGSSAANERALRLLAAVICSFQASHALCSFKPLMLQIQHTLCLHCCRRWTCATSFVDDIPYCIVRVSLQCTTDGRFFTKLHTQYSNCTDTQLEWKRIKHVAYVAQQRCFPLSQQEHYFANALTCCHRWRGACRDSSLEVIQYTQSHISTVFRICHHAYNIHCKCLSTDRDSVAQTRFGICYRAAFPLYFRSYANPVICS